MLNPCAMPKHQASEMLVAAGDGLHGAFPELLVRVGLDKPRHCPHEPWAQSVLLQRIFDDQVGKVLKRSSTGYIHHAVCEYQPLRLIQKSYTIKRITVSKSPIDASRSGTRYLGDARNGRAFKAIFFKCS